MTPPNIEVRNLSKIYRIYGNPYHRLLESLPWVHEPKHQQVAALKDIEFSVAPGECMGLIGSNGAGKSTLLKILSGTTTPTTGSYTTRGRVASLLELGAGFHQDFTGRENIYMNAAMMGFSRKEARRKFDEILEFSELHDFIDAPIRTYSSGMICRLGFSVAVAVEPDVLIIDEILAVGDMNFQRKCIDRIWDYKARGKTLFFCSHSLYDVRQICDRAIWLRKGKMELMDDAVLVTNDYASFENTSDETRDPMPWDDQPKDDTADHPRVVQAVLFDPKTGEERSEFSPREPVGLRAHIRNPLSQKLVMVVGFMRKDGTCAFAPGTHLDGQQAFEFKEGHVSLIIDDIRLLSGEFSVPVWLMDEKGVHRFHELPATKNLLIKNRTKELGLFIQDRRWTFEPTRDTTPADAGQS